jgi:adenylate kinase family enzyme
VSRRLSRVSVITSASGSGGTTFGRTLAERLGVPFHELDALFWKPGWTESTPEELLAAVEPIVASDAWVIDGGYYGKLGDLVYRNADLVVWLDLAPHVWLPRLVRRTFVRAARGELIWGTNRESLRTALFRRDSLLWWTIRWYPRRRRSYPARIAPFRHVRLRSTRDVERFLRGL